MKQHKMSKFYIINMGKHIMFTDVIHGGGAGWNGAKE